MDKAIYKYSMQRALLYIGAGFIGLIISLLSIPIVSLFGFFFGVTLFIMGVTAFVKRKPQILIDEEGIYLGFKTKKKFNWKQIVAVNVFQEKVDSRMVWMIRIQTQRIRKGYTSSFSYKENLDLLSINKEKMMNEIHYFKKTPELEIIEDE